MARGWIWVAGLAVAASMAFMTIKGDSRSGETAFTGKADSCELPRHIEPYDYDASENPNDWLNPDVETTGFMLTLSWSPNYCANRNQDTMQCNRDGSSNFGLVVHGLWGQSKDAGRNYRKHPRNCHNTGPINTDIVREYLCMIPSERLIQSQWEKHGTCDFRTPKEYLSQTRKLLEQLNIPSNEELAPIASKGWAPIKQLILNANQAQGLQQNQLFVQMDRNSGQLREIRICYDLDFQFSRCP